MRKLIVALLLAGIAYAAPVIGQNKPLQVPPTEVKLEKPVNSDKIQVVVQKQKNVSMQFQLFQQQVQQQTKNLQDQYNDYEKQISAWIEEVKKDNQLGDDVTYDRDTDKWVKVPKPAAPEKPATPEKAPAK